jgi:subtilisin family serine protease
MRWKSFGSTAAVTLLGGVLLLLAPVRLDGQRGSRLERQLVNGMEAVAGEALVRFREPVSPPALQAIVSETAAQRIEPVGRAGAVLIRSRSMSAAALVEMLSRRPDVAYAEPNFVVTLQAAPNDALFPFLWGLESIKAPAAWDLATGSAAHVVAVIDTGIDYTHPDLAPNMWSAPAAFTVNVDGVAISCPQGTHGFNAISRTCNPMDDHSHGTHVAGTIGAVGNDGIGVAGVNWTTRLMGIKFLDASGSGTTADAIAAVEFAIAVKQAFAATGGADVRVLSNSWGGPSFSQALLDQVRAANDAEMLVVAGAGNDGSDNDLLPFYPASFDAPNVVAVAATTITDEPAWFSNYGASSVDLAAPGDLILSTVVGGGYEYNSGTSMATPHVSGAAALVLSHCSVDTAALQETLLGTVDPIPGFAGLTVSGGRLNVHSALHACTAAPSAPILDAHGSDGRVTLTWTGSLGALRYDVRRGLTAGGPYTALASDITGTVYVDTSVTNGTTYYYVVTAENSVGESGDSNEASATPKVPPDLTVMSFIAPAVGSADATVEISIATKNQGPGLADASTTRFYLSTNTTPDASDTLLADAQSVPSLASGATASASMTLVIPPGVATGKHFLIALADADDVLDETSESNNRMSRGILIGPDLTVAVLDVPAGATPGGTIAVSDTIHNQGGGAAGAFRTTFYFSTNNVIGGDDVLLGSRAIPGLAAGGTTTETATLSVPAELSVGTYYILAKADGQNEVDETFESNNVYGRTIQIGGDLVVSGLNAPASGAAGSAVTVTDTTKNKGGGAVGATITRFFLSADTVLDAGDVLLAGSRAVPPLAANAVSSGQTSVMIPAATAPGGYYLIGEADGGGSEVETSETNNTHARYITVGSDLVITAFTVPVAMAPGVTITVADTTRNQGAGGAPASVTKFYLSANGVLDAGDALLPGARQVPDLAPGASHAGSTTVTLPTPLASGSYFLIARADGDNDVHEVNEGNNIQSRAVQIGGELVVSAFAVPARGGAGLSLSVSDTTANQGGAPVPATSTTFYLSTNIYVDGGDALLGSRSVPELAPGTGTSASTTLTIPANASSGTFYLIARADTDQAVAEASETNNTFVRSIVIGPDLWVTSMSVPAKGGAGETIVVSEKTANKGAGIAGASTTRFYLSPDGKIDVGAAPLDGVRLVSQLPPYGSSTGSTVVTIPAGTPPGTIYIVAQADAYGEVDEAAENNNVASRSIIIGPDLRVSLISLSAPTIAAGATLNVTDAVTNQGGGAAGPSATRFYLSTNTSVGGGDLLLSASRALAEVTAGASNTGTTAVTIPPGTAPGSYYLIARADGNGEIAESTETNNALARAIQVTPAP